MEFSKISPSSGSSSAALLPETSNNRYEQLDLSNQNAVEQGAPSCLSSALKVLLAVPLFLIHTIGKALQAFENAGLSLINCLRNAFSLGAAEVVDASKLTDLSKEIYNKPLLKTDTEETKMTSSNADETEKANAHAETVSEIFGNPEDAVTITLVEGDANDWEEDVSAPGHLHVKYPKPTLPLTPSNKGGYWNTITKTVGLLTVLTGLAFAGYSFYNPDTTES